MERDQIIARVRKETGVKLSPSDPVLAVVAINEALLEEAVATLDKSVKVAVDRFAAAGVQNEASARKVAGDIITKAADWLEGRFKAVAQEATAGMLAELREETAKAEAASRTAVRAAWAAGVIGAAALSAIAGFGIAGL